jgi:hypothetical protein
VHSHYLASGQHMTAIQRTRTPSLLPALQSRATYLVATILFSSTFSSHWPLSASVLQLGTPWQQPDWPPSRKWTPTPQQKYPPMDQVCFNTARIARRTIICGYRIVVFFSPWPLAVNTSATDPLADDTSYPIVRGAVLPHGYYHLSRHSHW